MAISQKEAVVNFTLKILECTTFKSGVDNALTYLTNLDLEKIKDQVYNGIMAGQIQYGKALSSAEVRSYSRSVTMNHLKKAKELNGGVTKTTTQAVSKGPKPAKSIINLSSIPTDLKENLDIALGQDWTLN